jgi:hypothetical protein
MTEGRARPCGPELLRRVERLVEGALEPVEIGLEGCSPSILQRADVRLLAVQEPVDVLFAWWGKGPISPGRYAASRRFFRPLEM